MVIIAAGPRTLRSGRSAIRSIATPSTPDASIVIPKAASSTPSSGRPASCAPPGITPNASSAHMPTNEPTMKTLKWAKLMSSRMP